MSEEKKQAGATRVRVPGICVEDQITVQQIVAYLIGLGWKERRNDGVWRVFGLGRQRVCIPFDKKDQRSASMLASLVEDIAIVTKAHDADVLAAIVGPARGVPGRQCASSESRLEAGRVCCAVKMARALQALETARRLARGEQESSFQTLVGLFKSENDRLQAAVELVCLENIGLQQTVTRLTSELSHYKDLDKANGSEKAAPTCADCADPLDGPTTADECSIEHDDPAAYEAETPTDAPSTAIAGMRAMANNPKKRCGACNREHTGTSGDNAWATVYLGIQHDDTGTEMLGPIAKTICGPECLSKALDDLVEASKKVERDVRPGAKA